MSEENDKRRAEFTLLSRFKQIIVNRRRNDIQREKQTDREMRKRQRKSGRQTTDGEIAKRTGRNYQLTKKQSADRERIGEEIES